MLGETAIIDEVWFKTKRSGEEKAHKHAGGCVGSNAKREGEPGQEGHDRTDRLEHNETEKTGTGCDGTSQEGTGRDGTDRRVKMSQHVTRKVGTGPISTVA